MTAGMQNALGSPRPNLWLSLCAHSDRTSIQLLRRKPRITKPLLFLKTDSVPKRSSGEVTSFMTDSCADTAKRFLLNVQPDMLSWPQLPHLQHPLGFQTEWTMAPSREMCLTTHNSWIKTLTEGFICIKWKSKMNEKLVVINPTILYADQSQSRGDWDLYQPVWGQSVLASSFLIIILIVNIKYKIIFQVMHCRISYSFLKSRNS